MWVLDVISSIDSTVEKSFHLIAGEWSIGRKKCHFNFNADASISRNHALLRIDSLSLDELKRTTSRPNLVLVDLNSRFGSFVNEEQVFGEKNLGSGDLITFGAKRTVLRVRYQVFILVPSRIQRSNRARINEICRKTGMHLVNSQSKDATHCIMDSGKLVATVKVLWALVFNQPVVCTPWLDAILERKNLSEPLPRCDDFLPTDPNMPSMAKNYLPNPLRKTLFVQHVVVFLAPATMESLISAMGGIEISAYKDPHDNQMLLREIELHSASRNVLIVEPMPSHSFSSTCGHEESGSIEDFDQGAVDRRLKLFKSMSAPFVTIQELAASVIFVKTPAISGENSFSCSPSVPFTKKEVSQHDDGIEAPLNDYDDENTIPMKKQELPEKVYLSFVPESEKTQIESHSLNSNVEPKEDAKAPLVSETPIVIKEESVIASSSENKLQLKDQPIRFQVQSTMRSLENTHNDTENEDSITTHSNSELSGTSNWVSVRKNGPKRNVDEPAIKPMVVMTQLIFRANKSKATNKNSSANYKRFKKGNICSSNRSHLLFPTTTIPSVSVGVMNHIEDEQMIEQERIAEELFEMVEKRGSTRRRKSWIMGGYGAKDVYIEGNLAYAIIEGDGLVAFDVNNPEKIQKLARSDCGQFGAKHLQISKKIIYLTAGKAGLRILMHVLNSIEEIGALIHDKYPAKDIAVMGDVALVTYGIAGLRCIDITDPSNPTELGAYALDHHSATHVTASAGWAYVSFGHAGIRILDVTCADEPVELGSYIAAQFYARNMVLYGKWLYVAYSFGGLQILDISNPSVPILISTYNPRIYPVDHVFVKNSFAFVSVGAGGLRVVDCMDPCNIKEVGSYYEERFHLRSCFVSEDMLAYVCLRNDGFCVLDVRDPCRIARIGSYEPDPPLLPCGIQCPFQ